ncbi:hypothetical protein IWW34DRAFT_841358 [Fusarium oxysporum f. sp. albedinis]|nr:hypothetical protein IWW34DRAFT_841358 [Fusarium oxysporum f. sp. albedinis]KAJ0132028.1 Uncharacterized protein HZ326_24887 [Fusarium oxysporum f. sp. albedinis]KAK2482264.1 hypothetical protein H9L39_04056 [Fusarium oxysporum f. sp. albedinis]
MVNWRTWLIIVSYMAIIGSSTLSYFYPTLVNGLGYATTKAQYMTIPIFSITFIVTTITGYLANKKSHLCSAILAMPNETHALSLAFVNAMGNLAQIYEAYLFPAADKPKYLKGFSVISRLCFTGAISYIALHILLRRLKQI